MACDICGMNDAPLVDLREPYQTATIKQICPGCEKVVNRKLSDVRSLTHNIVVDLMKRFMRARKGEPT